MVKIKVINGIYLIHEVLNKYFIELNDFLNKYRNIVRDVIVEIENIEKSIYKFSVLCEYHSLDRKSQMINPPLLPIENIELEIINNNLITDYKNYVKLLSVIPEILNKYEVMLYDINEVIVKLRKLLEIAQEKVKKLRKVGLESDVVLISLSDVKDSELFTEFTSLVDCLRRLNPQLLKDTITLSSDVILVNTYELHKILERKEI